MITAEMRRSSARQLNKGRSLKIAAHDDDDCAEPSDDCAAFLIS